MNGEGELPLALTSLLTMSVGIEAYLAKAWEMTQ